MVTKPLLLDGKNVQVSEKEFPILVNFLATLALLKKKSIYLSEDTNKIESMIQSERMIMLEEVAELDEYDIAHIIEVVLQKHD